MARILGVDDEPEILDLLSDFLSEGHSFVGCSNVASALDHLASTTFDLVITDLAMPGAFGTDLIEHLMRHRPNLPFLVVSGLVNIDQYQINPAYCLSKPFRRQDLLDRVAHMLKVRGL